MWCAVKFNANGTISMTNELTLQDEELLKAAREAAEEAYAKYSKFKVGAIVQGLKGQHRGVNVENASYGLSLCAERSALTAAIAAGDRDISVVAIACISVDANAPISQRMPCGACRQWLQELAPDARILIDGAPRAFSVQELLPLAFTLPDNTPDGSS